MSPFQKYFKETVTKRYSDFEGRARRSEYWYFTLFYTIIYLVIYSGTLAGILGDIPIIGGLFGLLTLVFALGMLVPSLAVAVRRLHDTGKSGWLLLIGLIPLVGGIILLVFLCTDSTPGANAYGPNPKELQEDDLVGNLID